MIGFSSLSQAKPVRVTFFSLYYIVEYYVVYEAVPECRNTKDGLELLGLMFSLFVGLLLVLAVVYSVHKYCDASTETTADDTVQSSAVVAIADEVDITTTAAAVTATVVDDTNEHIPTARIL